jgi:tetratricopeptide (TPR) repeat protein
MDTRDYSKICFAVMPFGKKTVQGQEIDFDWIYSNVFVPAIKGVPLPEGGLLEPRRTDKDFVTGEITVEMFRYLEYSRMVIADITGLNANVFYELGLRHRGRQSGTAILRQVQYEDKLPFDISHIKAFPYRYEPETDAAKAREDIRRLLENSVREDRTDNLVKMVLQQERDAPAEEKIDHLLQDAEKAIRSMDPARAIHLYREAVAKNPRNAIVRLKLALLLKDQGGKWAEVLEHCNTAVRLAPEWPDAWREKGIAEGKLKMPEAKASLERAEELNPHDYDALSSLGGVLKREGDLEGALERYRRATKESNGHTYPLLNELVLEGQVRGQLDLTRRGLQLAKAERVRREHVNDKPPYDSPWCFFDLALIRLFQGDGQEFLKYTEEGCTHSNASWMAETFRKTLELLPADQFAAVADGIAYLKDAEEQLPS